MYICRTRPKYNQFSTSHSGIHRIRIVANKYPQITLGGFAELHIIIVLRCSSIHLPRVTYGYILYIWVGGICEIIWDDDIGWYIVDRSVGDDLWGNIRCIDINTCPTDQWGLIGGGILDELTERYVPQIRKHWSVGGWKNRWVSHRSKRVDPRGWGVETWPLTYVFKSWW